MNKVNPIIIACYLLFFSVNVSAQTHKLTIEEITPFQQKIIAELTGHAPMEDGSFLAERSSEKQRKEAVQYFTNHFDSWSIPVNNHRYKIPHGYIFPDLLFKPVEGVNAVGTIPSTNNSDSFVIIGAHYDTERGSPGAIDNASGVAVCLAIAKKFSSIKERNFNLMIVLFDQEEDNEVGSAAFAKKLKKNGKQVHSVHITDLIAWDENRNRAIDLQSPTPYLEKLYKSEAAMLHIPIRVVKGGASDNKSFLALGYPTVGVFEEASDSTPHLHRSTDTYETVNFKYLARATQLMFNVLKTINNEN